MGYYMAMDRRPNNNMKTYTDEDLNQPIFHLTLGDLSQNNMEILDKIKSNQNIELANRLLAQSYLFLNSSVKNTLNMDSLEGLVFRCAWCTGCKGCATDDGECSKYCLHDDNCALAKFMEKLEKEFEHK